MSSHFYCEICDCKTYDGFMSNRHNVCIDCEIFALKQTIRSYKHRNLELIKQKKNLEE